MRRDAVGASLKSVAVATLAGCACFWWFAAPVLGIVGVSAWRAVGLAGAAVIGGIGTVWTGSWLRVSVAVAVGLVAAGAWAEISFSDVHLGLWQGVVAAIVNDGRDVLGPFAAASTTGAFAPHCALWRIAKIVK